MENIFKDYADSVSAARKGAYMAADEKIMKTPATNPSFDAEMKKAENPLKSRLSAMFPAFPR